MGRTKPPPRRRAAAGAFAALLLVALVCGTGARAAPRPRRRPPPSGLDPRITEIMRKPEYRHAQWGLLQTEPGADGRVLRSLFPGQFFIPGSTAKLFPVSGTWQTLGAGHRFVTPSTRSASAAGRR
ncbi:hypothetical protein GCM10020254_02430 [Streptomyces goshikiensis]